MVPEPTGAETWAWIQAEGIVENIVESAGVGPSGYVASNIVSALYDAELLAPAPAEVAVSDGVTVSRELAKRLLGAAADAIGAAGEFGTSGDVEEARHLYNEFEAALRASAPATTEGER